MARPQLTTLLQEFRQVVKEMRDHGVASWVGSPIGDVVLGAPPPSKATKADKDPNADRRNYYSELFGRPVTGAELEKLP
jgi:hypothetical protein